MNICGRCHGLDYYVTPRSRKSWELTVYRMRDYGYDQAGTFTDNEAETAVNYLAAHFGENSSLDATEHFGPDWQVSDNAAAVAAAPARSVPPRSGPPEATADQGGPTTGETPIALSPPAPDTPGQGTGPRPAPPLDALTVGPHPGTVSARVRELLSNPPRRPGPRLLLGARCAGYSAVLSLLGLLLTGHGRRRLRGRFRPVHALFALGLFLSLACHGLVYLARYGTPPVLWYWFGAGSFLVLVLAQVQGILRKRFGRLFLRVHVRAGYAGLSLAVLHWVWAWL